MAEQVQMYIDGAVLGPEGPGAYAIVAVRDQDKQLYTGLAEERSVNRMDLLAVIRAISELRENEQGTILTDSSSIVRVFRENLIPEWQARNWRRSRGKVKNRDLWMVINRYQGVKDFSVKYIDTRDRNENNQLAHNMATAMLDKNKGERGNKEFNINVTNIAHSLKNTLPRLMSYKEEDDTILISTLLRTNDDQDITVRINPKNGRYTVDDMGQTANLLAMNPFIRTNGPHPASLGANAGLTPTWNQEARTLEIQTWDLSEIGEAILTLAIAVKVASGLAAHQVADESRTTDPPTNIGHEPTT